MSKGLCSDYEVSSVFNLTSFENSECLKKEKKIKLKLRKSRIYRQKNHGSWTWEEEERFVTFMNENRQIFEDKDSRRSQKIFRKMSKFMSTRSSEQCRSHHQKYEIKFQTFQRIVDHIWNKLKEMQSPKAPILNKNLKIVVPQTHFQPSLVCQNQPFIFFPHILVGINKFEKESFSKDVTQLPPSSQILESGNGYQIIESNEIPEEISVLLDLPKFFGY